MTDLDLATIEARAAARPLRDNDGHEDFEALLAEVKRLRDRLSSWDNAVEHVTKGGKSARSVSSSEGWTLCHAEFHSDLMCEVERLTAEHAHLTSFVNKGLDEEKRLAAEVERLKAHIWNTGIDDLEARLSLAEGRRDEARAQVAALRGALEDVTCALEGAFPPGDESVGLPEFPAVSLSEAWARRCRARAALAATAPPDTLHAGPGSGPEAKAPRRQAGSPEGGGSIPPTAPTCDCIGQFGGHDPRCATVQKPPTEPTCATCGKPATCIGRYEDMTEDDPACDDCCGHGNEDGHCEPITCTRCGGKGDDPEHAGACGDCAGTGSKP